MARCGERRARDLLGVEPVRAALRRVLPDGERAGQRLGCELAGEAGLIADFARAGTGGRRGSLAGRGGGHWVSVFGSRAPLAASAATPARASANASRSTETSPTWLARRRTSFAFTIWLASSSRSRWVSISAW